MLKKMLASLALTVGIIHPSIASEKLSLEVICTDLENISTVLEKHGERPALTAVSIRPNNKDKEIPIPTVMFINFESGSWTLVERVRTNLYCATAMGEKMSPYFEQKK